MLFPLAESCLSEEIFRVWQRNNNLNDKKGEIKIGKFDAVLEKGSRSRKKNYSVNERIFDHIGITAPITLIPKILLQESWKIKANCGMESLPEEIAHKFDKWVELLPMLEELKVPRFQLHKSAKNSLNVFCDASQQAYVTCIFLRVANDQRVIKDLLKNLIINIVNVKVLTTLDLTCVSDNNELEPLTPMSLQELEECSVPDLDHLESTKV
ncbi:integrase catalytic domain-containing protein [Trichonephila clavata]|uniref:Integrase catalytic domain-containing protein n=1 Tax=Trichonephila clavata TaxID=2740835 RepID=A0A8X6GUC1_TRICU|nr:integrase catalytic domain-containing protein [Trichonephila clavata]